MAPASVYICGGTAESLLGVLQIQPMTSFLGKLGFEKELLSAHRSATVQMRAAPEGLGSRCCLQRLAT